MIRSFIKFISKSNHTYHILKSYSIAGLPLAVCGRGQVLLQEKEKHDTKVCHPGQKGSEGKKRACRAMGTAPALHAMYKVLLPGKERRRDYSRSRCGKTVRTKRRFKGEFSHSRSLSCK